MSAARGISQPLTQPWRGALPKPVFMIGLGLLASGFGFAMAHVQMRPDADRSAAIASGANPGGGSSAEPPHVFAAPTRPSAHRAPTFVLPSVPDNLMNPPRLTLEIETRTKGDGGTGRRKTVTRGTDRIHVRFGTNGPEWLFFRNPSDPRRMTATRVDHPHRTLVEYEEAELRSSGLGRGWADVVSLGVEPEALARLEATGRNRSLGGYQFSQARAKADASGAIREVWWSAEAATALSVTIGSGPTERQVIVLSLQRTVDEALLADPRRRYPTYSVMDVSDYREKHHEHAGEPGHVGDPGVARAAMASEAGSATKP